MPRREWKEKWETVGAETQGGQGKVAKVRSRSDGTVGALKTLLGDRPPDSTRIARFTREVAALRLLDGRGVPRVLDDNTADLAVEAGEPWVVMEWVEGPRLVDAVSSRPLEFSAALALVDSLAEIVERCEARGVFHRDIKPENVILRSGPTGPPYLVDFGAAWLSDDSISAYHTAAGEDLSSRFLVLPELMSGGHPADRNDSVTDATLLAGILFYCLTGEYPRQLRDANGRPPEDRPLPERVRAKLEADPRWHDVVRLFRMAFQQETKKRIQSVSELRQRLKPIRNPTTSIQTASVPRDGLDIVLSSSDSIETAVNVEVMKAAWKAFSAGFRLPPGIVNGGSGPNASLGGKRVESHFYIAWGASQDVRASYSHVTSVADGKVKAAYRVESGEWIEYYEGPIADRENLFERAQKAGADCCGEVRLVLEKRLHDA